ncbi:unnamed protein product [Cercospora beticola]|nr:unnamed protein product [Cercospora beticola]
MKIEYILLPLASAHICLAKLTFCQGYRYDLGQSLCKKKGGFWANQYEPEGALPRSRSKFYCKLKGDKVFTDAECVNEYKTGFKGIDSGRDTYPVTGPCHYSGQC